MKRLQQHVLFLIFCLVTPLLGFTQNYQQTIRGQIIDQDTRQTLPGANVVVMGSDPVIGTTTDFDGKFRLENVPVGRVSVQVTFVGYNPATLKNLNLTSSKELVLKVELEEMVITTGEVVISATRDKTKVMNDMTTVSARTFSVEESQRFAGGRNDVSRMASNFAGVRSSNDAVNDIVIRGNSPLGLLWRMEGVDIPNPNHFGDGGSTGGPVSMLNNNVLENSDFLTGAFPAEYGNAISGVFDLRMRNGNDEKHEFLGQVGFNGFEFGAEGPLSKKTGASYLINYRYSTIGFMQAIGIEVGTGAAVPNFQDVTFKLHAPTKKFGKFSLFGMGGTSSIDFIESTRDTTEDSDNFFAGEDQDVSFVTRTGVVGLNHTFLINNTTYTKASLSMSGSLNRTVADSIIPDIRSTVPFYRQDFERLKFIGSFSLNKKLSTRHHVKVGGFFKQLNFNLVDSVFTASIDRFRTITDFDGGTQLLQPYASWKFKINDKVTLKSGIHYQYLALNGANNLEPRLGLSWKLDDTKTINFGYGLHSQLAPLNLYFQQVRLADGTFVEPNSDLDFTRSQHFVVGYDWNFSENNRLKVEGYYQDITDAIVEVGASSYSLLNQTTFSAGPPDSLNNDGSGYNFGTEITLEKFLDRGLYYLGTLSVYESRYRGSDGEERNTAHAGRYVFNALGGKEFKVGSKKENSRFLKTITVDLKFTMSGGQRYTPVDIEASQIAGETIRRDELAFTEQFTDYVRFDFRAGFNLIGKKASQEWVIDIQNVTNRENPLFQQVNLREGTVQNVNQLGIFPLIQYRITF